MLELLVNGHVRCGVLDHGPGFAARGHQGSAGGGFGLMIVEQLADRWGMERSPERTEVWFERHCS
jgi:hypothetical protein